MNKRGQLVVVNIMIGLALIIVGVVVIDPLKEVLTIASNSDNLDCSNASIGTGNRMTCIVVDFVLPYFIGMIMAVAGAFVFAKGVRPDSGGG